MRKLILLLSGTIMSLTTMARDFSYTYEDQTVTYTVIDEATKTCKTKEGEGWGSGNSVSGNLILPSNPMDGNTEFTLTEIGYRSFGSNPVTSVIIPNTVTEIGREAFTACQNLKKSAYPSTVSNPFQRGIAIAYPAEGVIIENGYVYGPDKSAIYFAPITLEGEFIIPNSVKTIGEQAFYGCSGLTSVTIGNSVTEIGKEAFFDCRSLTSVNIPNSVSKIGERSFMGCSTLTSVIIPSSVTEIGKEAFRYCSSLTSAVIPNSVTKISESTFSDCSGLTSVTIPNSVTEIGSNAFARCNSLTSIIIPNSVTKISEGSFIGCSSLTSFVIPNSVTEIGSSSFASCVSLTSVIIPNSVTEIGDNAFSWCNSLTSIRIPSSAISIGRAAFSGCSLLESINVEEGNQNYCSIDGVLFNFDTTNILQCPAGKTESYNIPNTVTKIGDYAFFGCSSLSSVEIPNSVTEIGENAFYRCSSLTSIVIPNSVTEIGNGAFYICSILTSVTYNTMTPIECNSRIFENTTYNNAELIIPEGAKETFMATTPWNMFLKITEKDLGGIEDVIVDTNYSIDYNAFYDIYNLNGIKIDADTLNGLAPGYYIIRQGTLVQKLKI